MTFKIATKSRLCVFDIRVDAEHRTRGDVQLLDGYIQRVL